MNDSQLLKLYRDVLNKEHEYINTNINLFIDWSTFRCHIEEEIHARMGTIWQTAEFAKEYPPAFDALPVPYQNDSCLEFYLNDRHELCAKPKEDQSAALGNWVMVFDSRKSSWTHSTLEN